MQFYYDTTIRRLLRYFWQRPGYILEQINHTGLLLGTGARKRDEYRVPCVRDLHHFCDRSQSFAATAGAAAGTATAATACATATATAATAGPR